MLAFVNFCNSVRLCGPNRVNKVPYALSVKSMTLLILCFACHLSPFPNLCQEFCNPLSQVVQRLCCCHSTPHMPTLAHGQSCRECIHPQPLALAHSVSACNLTCSKSVPILTTKSEVGGLSSTGKSFRVVRACARCVCLVSSG